MLSIWFRQPEHPIPTKRGAIFFVILIANIAPKFMRLKLCSTVRLLVTLIITPEPARRQIDLA
jgi:hypothetical protein